MAGARQGQPARVRAPQRGASARFGLPRRFFAVAGGGGSGWLRGGMGRAAMTPGGHGKANPLVFAVCSSTRIPHVVARAIDRNQTPTAPPAKFLTRM
jgi:hypothetical protein